MSLDNNSLSEIIWIENKTNTLDLKDSYISKYFKIKFKNNYYKILNIILSVIYYFNYYVLKKLFILSNKSIFNILFYLGFFSLIYLILFTKAKFDDVIKNKNEIILKTLINFFILFLLTKILIEKNIYIISLFSFFYWIIEYLINFYKKIPENNHKNIFILVLIFIWELIDDFLNYSFFFKIIFFVILWYIKNGFNKNNNNYKSVDLDFMSYVILMIISLIIIIIFPKLFELNFILVILIFLFILSIYWINILTINTSEENEFLNYKEIVIKRLIYNAIWCFILDLLFFNVKNYLLYVIYLLFLIYIIKNNNFLNK